MTNLSSSFFNFLNESGLSSTGSSTSSSTSSSTGSSRDSCERLTFSESCKSVEDALRSIDGEMVPESTPRNQLPDGYRDSTLPLFYHSSDSPTMDVIVTSRKTGHSIERTTGVFDGHEDAYALIKKANIVSVVSWDELPVARIVLYLEFVVKSQFASFAADKVAFTAMYGYEDDIVPEYSWVTLDIVGGIKLNSNVLQFANRSVENKSHLLRTVRNVEDNTWWFKQLFGRFDDKWVADSIASGVFQLGHTSRQVDIEDISDANCIAAHIKGAIKQMRYPIGKVVGSVRLSVANVSTQ